MTVSIHEAVRDAEGYLASVRGETVRICAPLETEDYVVQPAAEVSPPKWHLAHTSWFFEEFILAPHVRGYRVFDPAYRFLFNSYYKTVGPHCLQAARGTLSRPTVDEVLAYRSHVDRHLADLVGTGDTGAEIRRLITAGLHHEQQHQELLYMDIKYILGANPSMPSYARETPRIAAGEPGWVGIEAGIHEVGAAEDGFAYDNERPRHRVWIDACSISRQLVANAEYLEFIRDGGYADPALWLSKGWDWVQAGQVRAPLYWFERDGQWHEFTLAGARPLAADAPVAHISYFEADAYARWRGFRLPGEQELEVFLVREDPPPSLWCWTRSPYAPYPGYRPCAPPLSEYNGKFMCNQYVLRGGCFATPRGHGRATYRNFFEPHQRWMFSGIRLARD